MKTRAIITKWHLPENDDRWFQSDNCNSLDVNLGIYRLNSPNKSRVWQPLTITALSSANSFFFVYNPDWFSPTSRMFSNSKGLSISVPVNNQFSRSDTSHRSACMHTYKTDNPRGESVHPITMLFRSPCVLHADTMSPLSPPSVLEKAHWSGSHSRKGPIVRWESWPWWQ